MWYVAQKGGILQPMRMPERIDPEFIAPCGVDCFTCYSHLYKKRPCPGCRVSDQNKSPRCRECLIKQCVLSKGITFCHECEQYPCARIENLAKRYARRYSIDLIDNGHFASHHGLEALLENERELYTCKECGHVLCEHDHSCTNPECCR